MLVMKKLYKFHQSYRRMGDLDGVFVAEESEVKEAIGKEVYFGEVLGKHSEIQGTLEEGDITELTDDATAIEVIEKYLHGGAGWNPLYYVVCPHGLNLDECVCEVCCCEHDEIKTECKKCKQAI